MKGQPFPRGCRTGTVWPGQGCSLALKSWVPWTQGFWLLFYFVLTEHEVRTKNKLPFFKIRFYIFQGCGHFIIKAHWVSTFHYIAYSQDVTRWPAGAPCEQAQAGNYLCGRAAISRCNEFLSETMPPARGVHNPKLNLPNSAEFIFLLDQGPTSEQTRNLRSN